MEESPDVNPKGRRKLLYWIAGALSAVMVWRLMPKTTETSKPVRMLTEDGQLVEVDVKHLTGKKQRIKSDDIHNWIKRKKNT
jgi:hypothetical protein